MTFKEFVIKVWRGHGWIGKFLTCFCATLFALTLIGLPFGITKCHYDNELVYSNTFLNEQIYLHGSNYVVTANDTKTVDSINILNKKGKDEVKEGHFIQVILSIFQEEDSNLKKHKFDVNDFKIKSHTGVYFPLNDIGSLIGWDMIDYHWDQAKNGFLISSAEFDTTNAVKDYSLIRNSISCGESKELTVFFPMDKRYNVEDQIMVLEIDFRPGGLLDPVKRGEDIILLPRPENLPKDTEE